MNLFFSVLGLIFGIGTGIITGVIPGIHVNVVASLMMLFYVSNSASSELSLSIAIYIVSVSITHAFFDYIPSLFLGVPADEVYSLLPGQRLIREGKGGEALRLSVEGSWRGLFLALIIAIIFIILALGRINLLAQVENFIKPILFWILLITSLVLITSEKKRLWAFSIFLLSGFFGIVLLGSPLIPGGSSAAFGVLFPALSGLFGISSLVLSLADEVASLPSQKQEISLNISKTMVNAAAFLGTVFGMAVGLLPGLGAANAATLVFLLPSNKQNEDNDKLYIVTTSAIQASDALFGIAALYFINKSRSGASVAIEAMLGGLNSWQAVVIITAMGVAGFVSRLILLRTWKLFLWIINIFNYNSLTLAVITLITLLVLLTTGFWGGIILLAATSLGLLPPIVNVRRSQMMGFFLIPVMLFFSGFQENFVSFFHLESQVSPSIPISLSRIAINLGICFSMSLLVYITTSFLDKKTHV